MKKIVSFIIALLLFSSVAQPAFADSSIETMEAMQVLTRSVTDMAKEINRAASGMMKFADMLMCNSLHGEASYASMDILGIITIKVHVIALDIWVASAILYTIGFFIMMIASFYLFDVAFNLAAVMLILPLGFALWPFAWTKDKLKPMIESVLFYTGIFIFLPLGIHIAYTLIMDVASKALGTNFIEAFNQDKSDLIRDNLSLFTTGFLKLLLCYILAIRIIPLMANDFCTHFFQKNGMGSPMSDKLAQFTHSIAQIGKRRLKQERQLMRMKAGNTLKNAGDSHGNFGQRTLYHLGADLAKKRRGEQ